MLNYLWTVMLVIGIIVGAATGNMQNISNAVVTSAQEAVELCITMLGIMVMWTGVMKIAQRAGLLDRLSHLFRPVIHFLFPNLPQDHPAGEYISTNCVANILGLGWAATPAGLKAMTELSKLEEERRHEEAARPEDERCREEAARPESERCREAAGQPEAKTRRRAGGYTRNMRLSGAVKAQKPGTASNEMCTFLILNISSLQLIPVSIIAYRSQYGSADPTAIVGPAILATAVSTAVAVVYCKLKDRRKRG